MDNVCRIIFLKTADPKLNLFNSHKRYVRNQGEGDNIIFLPLEVLIVWDYNLRLSSQGPRKKKYYAHCFQASYHKLYHYIKVPYNTRSD